MTNSNVLQNETNYRILPMSMFPDCDSLECGFDGGKNTTNWY